MSWDLWIDFQRADDEGFTHGNVRNLREDLSLKVGDVIVVGNEDAEPGVVELGDRGFVLVKVFRGPRRQAHALAPSANSIRFAIFWPVGWAMALSRVSHSMR